MDQSQPKIPVILLLCLGIQAFGWLYLTANSGGFAYEIANDKMPTWTFVAIQGVLGVVLIGAFFLFRDKFFKSAGLTILIGAVVLRLIAIPGEPIHESDFYRYLWDGKVAKHGINPYRFEPGALFLAEKEIDFEFNDKTTGVTWRGRHFSDDEKQILERLLILRDENPVLFERVSHPAVTTIYPPAAQWVFWFSERVFGDSVMGLKSLFVLFDIGCVCLILLILGNLNRSPFWAVLYAWNPLPIKEFANSGHYDAVAIFFMLLAVWMALNHRSVIFVVVALALGTLAKYFAILLLPVILVYLHEQSHATGHRLKAYFTSPVIWSGGFIFLIIVGLSFLPYILWNDAGLSEVFRGLSAYQKHWQYSPGLFALIQKSLGWVTEDSFSIAKKVAAGLLCGTVALVSLRSNRDLGWKCFAVMAALFVLSPTAFPWYFCWVLAFVPFQSRFSWLVLGLLLPLNYIDFHSLGNTPLANRQFVGFYATQLLSWGIFLITWIGESRRRLFV